MKALYTKVALYAHTAINSVIEQIDEIVLGKALSSMDNVKPCLEQCQEIIKFIDYKDKLIKLYEIGEEVLTALTPEEFNIIKYKYLKKTLVSVEEFDHSSRIYYRRQQDLCKKVSRLYEKHGINDSVFKNEYLPLPFIKRLVQKVRNQEIMFAKIDKGQKEELLDGIEKNEIA